MHSHSHRRGTWLVFAGVFVVGCGAEPTLGPANSVPNVSEVLAASAASTAAEYLLVLDAETGPSADLLAGVAAAGGEVTRRFDEIGVLSVRGLNEESAADLAARSDVMDVEYDEPVQWLPAPEGFTVEEAVAENHNDPSQAGFFPVQWNMTQIAADQAWPITPQGSGALVCILDSGLDPFHQDLAGLVDIGASASFIPEPDIPSIPGLDGQFDIFDYRFHGTFVGGIVASNGIGVAAVAPHANLCAVKVLDVTGSGPFIGVIAGIIHSALVGADAINMSLGALIPRKDIRADPGLGALIEATQRAIDFAVENGVVVVASSGNNGLDLDANSDLIHVPSQLKNVISVGATAPFLQQNFDALAVYSNFGKKGVDLAAPGGGAGASGFPFDGIVSVCSSFSIFFGCGTGTFYLIGGDGTSFAAPHVAGAAAVIESAVDGDQGESLLRMCLIRWADRPDGLIISPLYGHGRVNVLRSVERYDCGFAGKERRNKRTT